jgi:ribonuclease HI
MFSLFTNNNHNRKKNKLKVYPKCDNILYINGCNPDKLKFELPNHAGIGAVLLKNDKESWGYCRYLGCDFTPSESEYYAVIIGLEKALNDNIFMLTVCGDNLDVINQINNVSKIESGLLLPLYKNLNMLKAKFDYIDFNYINPEDNKRARELSSLAIKNLNPFEN